MRIGLYPGSFDPPTLGHFDIIKRSFALVDRLIIGIGIHATKTPLFSFEQREEMLQEELADFTATHNVTLEVIHFEGLLVDVAREKQATLIIRGLRNGGDYEYEAPMVTLNRQMNPEVEMVFLAAAPEVAAISSTLVRQIADFGGDISQFVPPAIAEKIKIEKLKQKK